MLAAPILGNLTVRILEKIIGGGTKKNIDVLDVARDKIVLRGQVNPKRKTLLDGRTFYTRYERVSRRNLPANVTIKRETAIEPRQQRKQKQGGSELFSSAFKLRSQLYKPSHIAKGIGNGLKVLNSALGKR